jgi:hypothetical protein
MELHYRGATYQQETAPIELTDSGVVGHYRGASVKLRQPRRPVVQPAHARLTYRGAQVR